MECPFGTTKQALTKVLRQWAPKCTLDSKSCRTLVAKQTSDEELPIFQFIFSNKKKKKVATKSRKVGFVVSINEKFRWWDLATITSP